MVPPGWSGDGEAALCRGVFLDHARDHFARGHDVVDVAHALPEYKQMLIDSSSDDIVYTSLFTGVKGNYLKHSVIAAGFDPDNMPEADKSKMNFGSGGNMEKKAWRDIWSGGQGVGNIHDIVPAGEVVARMAEEYAAAKRRLAIG
jgi:nitronate monooxygenase